MGRKESNGADRRKQILSVCAQEFARHGVAGTSMSDIARMIGVQKASLYYFFESKQDLLAAVLTPVVGKAATSLAAIEMGDGTAADKVRAGMISLGADFDAHHAEMQILVRERLEAHLSSDAYNAVKEAERAYIMSWRSVIRLGVSEGSFRDVDDAVAAFGLIGSLNWMYAWFQPGGTLTAREVGSKLAEIVLSGLLRPGAREDDGI